MTPLMKILLAEIRENRIQSFYTSQYYLYENQIKPQREELLLNALPEDQQALLESYDEAVMAQYDLEQEAFFLATLDMIKEFHQIFR